MGKRIDGVDLSHYQSGINIDWDAAKAAGLQFMYHKATEGTTGVDDSYGARRAQAKKHDVFFGAYHFARPTSGNAKAEAEHFLKIASPLPGDLAPALDLEVNDSLSEDELAAWVAEWFKVVFAAIGQRRGLLYTHYNLTRRPRGVYLWTSRYNNDNRAPIVAKPFHSWRIWQFSDGRYGTPSYMPGIGRVDLDTVHKYYPWARLGSLVLRKRKVMQAAPAPTKTVAPKTDFLDPANYPDAAHPNHNDKGPQITWLGQRLVAHGFGKHYSEGPGPNWGSADKANVADFQKAQGWTGSDADGYPGTETLRRLSAAVPKATKESPVARLLRIAGSQVGYHEGYSNHHWDNHQKFSPAVPGLEWSQNQAWCATFVSWCVTKAGLTKFFPITASTDAGAKWFKDRGQWNEYPAVGAQVFYGYGNDMNHTGLVYKYDDTYVYTIEGNTNTNGSAEGDGVYRKKRVRRDSYVRGYGYPAIPGGLKSADPNYKRSA